jgi:hypothetical protein
MYWIVSLVLPVLYIGKQIADYFFPGQLKVALINTYWNTLQLCSQAETYVSQTYKQLAYYIPYLQPNTNATVTFICDGDVVESYTMTEFVKTDHLTTNYDFILYEVPVKDNLKYDAYVFRYENYKDILPIEYNSLNDLNFLSIQLFHKASDITYTIHFGTKFYLLNQNVLFDYAFLKWYLYYHHSMVLNKSDTYVLSFIDHKMNYITLTENEYIIIRKNNYDIINLNDIKKN